MLPAGKLFTLGLQHVLVMYAGKVVEELRAAELTEARHPYTQGLFNCLPRIEGDLLEALAAAAEGDLGGTTLAASTGAAVTIVVAARDYPEQGDTGTPIEGIAEALVLPAMASALFPSASAERARFTGTVLVPIDGVDFAPYLRVLLTADGGRRVGPRIAVITAAGPQEPAL